jgi:transcriptional regulator NrdR family protein
MMYCPRCNNTHWKPTEGRKLRERLAWLLLRRPYRCIKCERIQLASIFLDFQWPGPRKPRRKIARDQGDITELKCPECGGSVRRSRRRGIERLMFFAKAYRCSECTARFKTFKLV